MNEKPAGFTAGISVRQKGSGNLMTAPAFAAYARYFCQ
jgi:hypothetical protein